MFDVIGNRMKQYAFNQFLHLSQRHSKSTCHNNIDYWSFDRIQKLRYKNGEVKANLKFIDVRENIDRDATKTTAIKEANTVYPKSFYATKTWISPPHCDQMGSFFITDKVVLIVDIHEKKR